MTDPFFSGIASPGTGDWQRSFQALQQRIDAKATREFSVCTRLTDSPELGRDVSSFRRTDTTTFESWYPAGAAGAAEKLTSMTASANTLYAVPHIFTAAHRIVDLGLDTVTGSGNGRVGIYDSRDDLAGNPYPNRLLYETGSTDISTAAVDTLAAVDVDVEPGRIYWFAFCASGTPTMRAVGRSLLVPILGWPATLGADPNCGYTVAHTYAALPDPFPDGATAFSSAALPAIFMRLDDGNLREYERVVPGFAPSKAGYILRRARLLWPAPLYPAEKASFITVRVGVRQADNFSSLGAFDTRTLDSVTPGTPFPLTGLADIDRMLVVSDVSTELLEARVIQAGFPRVSCADALVQWDLAYTGAG